MPNCFPEQQALPRDGHTAAPAADALLLAPTDPRYPAALHDLHDPPPRLWARGTLAIAAHPAVAIVGTRNATAYGVRCARAFATASARAGVAVVSGLARGIDGAAHHAALDARGRTVAVLGTGLDVVYPRQHRGLQQRIGAEGLLLSEHDPHSTGHAGAFPRRNRLIAALAQITVVVEAGASSGALHTATHAMEMGRTVGVVPGPIDASTSAGSNDLLRRGATPLLGADDLLSLLHIDPSPPMALRLDGDAASCWDALLRGASDLSSIARVAGLTTRRGAAAVSALELEGLVVVDATGRVRRTLEASIT